MNAAPPTSDPRPKRTHTFWPAGRVPEPPAAKPRPPEPAPAERQEEEHAPDEPGYGHGV